MPVIEEDFDDFLEDVRYSQNVILKCRNDLSKEQVERLRVSVRDSVVLKQLTIQQLALQLLLIDKLH